MDKVRLLTGWRRTTACVGGGFLLLILLRRCTRRRQSAALLLTTLFKPSCARFLHYCHVLMSQDSSGRLSGGFFFSLFKSLLGFIWPYRRLMRPVSTSSYEVLILPCSSMSAPSPDQAMEVHQNIDGTEQPEDGESERTTSHRGLEKEEHKVLDHLEPDIISTADPDDQCSGRCFFMKTGLPETSFLGCEADCPLIKWLQQRVDNEIKPLAIFEVQGISTQTYIRDEIKVLIKSLIQFVQYLHNQGQCASGGTFRAKNISVVGGNLRFHKLKLSSLTEELQQENYNSVDCMIRTVILREKAKQLPHDMQHLLKLLRNPRPHIYLISKHVALMNLRSCRDLYLLLWDKKKAMNPTAHSKWQNAVQDLEIRSWSEHISEESPLSKVYKGGKYKGDNKVHLIRFFRNAAAHLSEQSGRGERFQFEHISLIITAIFPTVLADLQERLYHHGIVQEFF